MAKDATKPLIEDPYGAVFAMQRTDKLDTLLAEEQGDCTPCRVIGAGAFIGLGAYTYLSGQAQLEQQRKMISGSRFGMQSRQAALTVMAFSLVGLGLYRLRN